MLKVILVLHMNFNQERAPAGLSGGDGITYTFTRAVMVVEVAILVAIIPIV